MRTWLSLCLALALLTPASPADVLLWQDPRLGRAPAVDAAALRAVVGEVRTVATGELAAHLAARPAGLVVLPYGPLFPAAARAALDGFLAAGGGCLSLGPATRTVPLLRAGDRWVSPEAGGDRLWAPAADATWSVSAGPEDQLPVTGQGTAAAPYGFAAEQVKGWAYRGLTVPAVTAPGAVLVVEARSLAGAGLLCCELREAGGARWKQIARLTSAWQEVRLPLGGFVAYASEGRGGAGDCPKLDQGGEVLWGFTRTLVGEGPQRFELRSVRLETSPLTNAAVAATGWRGAETSLVRQAFGKELVWPTPALTPRPAETNARRIEAAWLGGGTLVRLGWTDGPWAGGREAIVEAARLDPADPAQAAVLRPALDWLRGGVVGRPVEPRFEPAGHAVAATARVRLRAAAATAVTLRVGATTVPVDLPAGQTVEADLPVRQLAIPAGLGQWGTEAVLLVGTTEVDRFTWRVDARQALVAVADFLTARAGANGGKFGGVSFVDGRGARTLLAAYELTGVERYREAALSWGRAMLAEQREDGGYRMGYGITKQGESCYVADGGEIGLGIGRLVAYADPPERERLLASLQRYMGYRDSFRVPSGGIGVGWCLHDYGQRPVVPLPVPTKIFAPEMNLYTIGCTLGCAAVHAGLTGQAADRDAVARDADWLSERVKGLSGANAESYVYAHALTADAARRANYAAVLRQHTIDRTLAVKGAWWLAGEGRHALDLAILVEYARTMDPQPAVWAAAARGAWGLASPDSPDSLLNVIGLPNLRMEHWLRTCFGGLGLAEVVEPGVIMKRLPDPR